MIHIGLFASLVTRFGPILFALVLLWSFFAMSAVNPPAELALPTSSAAVAIHTGHIDSSWLSYQLTFLDGAVARPAAGSVTL